jgi:hypothetical protein
MKDVLRAGAAALAFLALVLLAACDSPPERRPGPAELALITRELDSQLNTPARQLQYVLKRAQTVRRIYADQIVVSGPAGLTPLDWWVARQGYIKFGGVDHFYHAGYFVLTAKGSAFVNGPPPSWLVLTLQGQPQVVCAGNSGFLSCRVTGVVTIKPSSEGAALFPADVSIPAQPFTGELQYGPSGWSADNVEFTGGGDLWMTIRTALFGDHDAIQKAHLDWGIRTIRND